MKNAELTKIIRDAHEKMAPRYGDLDIFGNVTPKTLPHWNYERNVKQPITHIVNSYLTFKPFKLLDAGCGNGQLFHLYSSLGAEIIYGVDFGIQMLTHAKHRAEANGIKFIPICGRLENMSFFRSDTVHLVNLYGVIEHIPDPARILAEIERLIMPGGLLIMGVPRKGSLAWLTYALFCPSIQDLTNDDSFIKRKKIFRYLFRKMQLYHFYNESELRTMMSALKRMSLIDRIPIAPGGVVGSPAFILRYFAGKGNYHLIDQLNRFAACMKMIPAGEYIVLQKS